MARKHARHATPRLDKTATKKKVWVERGHRVCHARPRTDYGLQVASIVPYSFRISSLAGQGSTLAAV